MTPILKVHYLLCPCVSLGFSGVISSREEIILFWLLDFTASHSRELNTAVSSEAAGGTEIETRCPLVSAL